MAKKKFVGHIHASNRVVRKYLYKRNRRIDMERNMRPRKKFKAKIKRPW